MWGAKTDSGTLILLCIPFSATDVSLGDEVEIDADFVLTNVLVGGGHSTFRVTFMNTSARVQERIIAQITTISPLIEHSSKHKIAISVPGSAASHAMTTLLKELMKDGHIQLDIGRQVSPDYSSVPRLVPPDNPAPGPRQTAAGRRSGSIVLDSDLAECNEITTDDVIVEHPDPLWKESADFVFHASLGTSDGVAGWEQLWGKRTNHGTVIVCCIPLWCRVFQLGDEVVLDDDNIFVRVARHGGQAAFKIFPSGVFDKVAFLDGITNAGAVIERYQRNVIGLSFPVEKEHGIRAFLDRWVVDGKLVYDSEPADDD